MRIHVHTQTIHTTQYNTHHILTCTYSSPCAADPRIQFMCSRLWDSYQYFSFNITWMLPPHVVFENTITMFHLKTRLINRQGGEETTLVSFGLEDLSTQEVRLIHVSTKKLKYGWFTVLLRQVGSLCEDCSISTMCGINKYVDFYCFCRWTKQPTHTCLMVLMRLRGGFYLNKTTWNIRLKYVSLWQCKQLHLKWKFAVV